MLQLLILSLLCFIVWFKIQWTRISNEENPDNLLDMDLIATFFESGLAAI